MVTNMAMCLVVFVYVETIFDVPGWVIAEKLTGAAQYHAATNTS
jgi:hypothetical protein